MRHIFSIILAVFIVGVVVWGVFLEDRFGADEPFVIDGAPRIERLADRAPDVPAADEDALMALATTLEGLVTVSFDGDMAVAGDVTTATDVTLTPAGMDTIGMVVGELTVWGADVEALEARLSGGSETVRVADRIDAKNIRWFGFDTLSNEMINELTASMGDEVPADVGRYDMTAARMIIDGMTIHPPDPGLPADSEQSGFMPFLAKLASYERLMSAEAMALYDTDVDFAIADGRDDMTMRITLPFVGYEGWSRGDLDFALIKGLEGSMSVASPDNAGGQPIAVGFAVEEYSIAGLRLAGLFEYLVRGELPPTSATDIMSLGVWKSRNLSYTMNGEPFYSLAESTSDLSGFHWLIPKRMTFTANDLVYDFNGIMKSEMEAEPQESQEQAQAILAKLDKYGLARPVIDYDLTMGWSPESGRSELDFSGTLEEFATLNYSFGGIIPTYDAFLAAERDEAGSVDWDAIGALAARDGALSDMQLQLVDLGGVDKTFALAVEFREFVPAEQMNPTVAALLESDPQQLKNGVAALINIAAPQMAQQFPPAEGYLKSVAQFLLQGGALTARVAPSAPLTQDSVQTFVMEQGGQPAPDAFIDFVGFTLTHTPGEPVAVAN
jgi:hypothetical protein